jgi:hypothetical protein
MDRACGWSFYQDALTCLCRPGTQVFPDGSTCECSKLFKTYMECVESDIVLLIHIFKWISWPISERETSKISPVPTLRGMVHHWLLYT